MAKKKNKAPSLAYREGGTTHSTLPWLMQVVQYDKEDAIAIFQKDNEQSFAELFMSETPHKNMHLYAAQSAACFISGFGETAEKCRGESFEVGERVLQRMANEAIDQIHETDFPYDEIQTGISLVAGYQANIVNSKEKEAPQLQMCVEIFRSEFGRIKGEIELEFEELEFERRIIFFSYCRGCDAALRFFGIPKEFDPSEFIYAAFDEASIPDEAIKDLQKTKG